MSVLVDESREFNPFLRGPSLVSISSRALDWKGLVVERRSADSGERPEAVNEHHIVALVCGQPWIGEHPNGRRGVVTHRNLPGRIRIIAPGIVPAIFSRNRCDHILCALEPSFVKGIEDELDRRPTEPIRSQMGIDDSPARHLMRILANEAARGGPLGRLYADHLGHALAIWLLFRGTTKRQNRAVASALPRHILRRVLDRMDDPLAKLDLATLAADSGYSRRHFLRMFHAATGYSPHQYVLQLRLKRAQELMRQRNISLIDIAAVCGFSSQAHLSKVFRQLLGVTPSEFRRNI
jgi:AraC family transcriptional regulator